MAPVSSLLFPLIPKPSPLNKIPLTSHLHAPTTQNDTISSMPPIKMKQSPNHTAQSLTTTTTSSQEARRLVRETLRISANLASSPSPSPPANPPTLSQSALLEDEFLGSTLRLICCEEIDGRRWKYVAERDASGRFKKNSIRAVGLQTPQAPVEVSGFYLMNYLLLLKKLWIFIMK